MKHVVCVGALRNRDVPKNKNRVYTKWHRSRHVDHNMTELI